MPYSAVSKFGRRRWRRKRKSFKARVLQIIFPPKVRETDVAQFTLKNILHGAQVASGGFTYANLRLTPHAGVRPYPYILSGTGADQHLGEEVFVRGFLFHGWLQVPASDANATAVYHQKQNELLNLMCIRWKVNTDATATTDPPYIYTDLCDVDDRTHPSKYQLLVENWRAVQHEIQIMSWKRISLTNIGSDPANIQSKGKYIRWYIPINAVTEFYPGGDVAHFNAYYFLAWVENGRIDQNQAWSLHWNFKQYFRDRTD